jgi:tRNA 2-thiouridine synthesizing protein E
MNAATANHPLDPILARLDAIAAEVTYVAERQRKQEDLIAEMMPIARAALADAIARLDALEKQGTFDRVREVAGALGSAMELARGLGAAADRAKPVGLLGAIRASKDHDVQKGLALVLEMLRRVGREIEGTGAAQLDAGDRKQKLAALLGPRRERARAAPKQLPAPAAAPACATPAPPVDISSWTPALGESIAAAEGVALTPAHWAVIDAARADYAASQASPNIRRLTQIANLATKELYALFPKAPGRTIAKIAGLPKPAGCL